MKTLLIITLFFSLAGKGQKQIWDTSYKVISSHTLPIIITITTDSIPDWIGDTSMNVTYTFHPKYYRSIPKYDTVKVLLWVSDTLIYNSRNPFHGNDIWQIRGYEVGSWEWPHHPDYSIYNEQKVWIHKEYLDENKKPLTLFVGMAFKNLKYVTH